MTQGGQKNLERSVSYVCSRGTQLLRGRQQHEGEEDTGIRTAGGAGGGGGGIFLLYYSYGRCWSDSSTSAPRLMNGVGAEKKDQDNRTKAKAQQPRRRSVTKTYR